MADDLEGLNFTISLDGSGKKKEGAYMKNTSNQRISTSVENENNEQNSFFSALGNIFTTQE